MKFFTFNPLKKLVVLFLMLTMVFGGLMSFHLFTKSDLVSLEKHSTKKEQRPEFQDGDIIFQISQSEQCRAVQLATKSQYAHCGIIFKENGQYRVYEAVQPVQSTSVEIWVKRGERGHYVVKRLKNAKTLLTADVLKKLKSETKKFLGRDYDITFEWSDEKIYCSELVWKAYKRAANVEVGKLEKLKDMDLSSANVKKIMKERYGNNIPLEETVITPASIFASDLLVTVFEN